MFAAARSCGIISPTSNRCGASSVATDSLSERNTHDTVRPRTIRTLPFVGVQDLDVRGLASQPCDDIVFHSC